jgi:hypothetical protein
LPGARIARPGQSNVGAGEKVEIRLSDLRGREIRTLFSGRLEAGRREAHFSADPLSSGVYTCAVRAGSHQVMRKMLLDKEI